MFGIGAQEGLVVLMVAMLLFGSRKLPEVGRSLGEAMREFRASLRHASDGEGDVSE